MDTFGLLGFIFGLMGLGVGALAFTQVEQLKKEVQRLRDQREGD